MPRDDAFRFAPNREPYISQLGLGKEHFQNFIDTTPSKHRGARPADITPNYMHGHLIEHLDVVPIFWGSWWRGQQQLVFDIVEFLIWFVKSPVMDLVAQDYSTGPYTIREGTVTLNGGTGFIIANEDPAGTVSEDDLQRNLKRWIASHSEGLPPADNQKVYVIYGAPGFSFATYLKDISCQEICGFHGAVKQNDSLNPDYNYPFYAVIGYPECVKCRDLGQLSIFEALTAHTSHELCEAVTDPIDEVRGTHQGWVAGNGEIVDFCHPQFDVLDDLEHGKGYVVRKIWSIRQNKCTARATPWVVLPYSGKDAPALCHIGDCLVLAYTDMTGHIYTTNNLQYGGLVFEDATPVQSQRGIVESSIDSPSLSPGPGNKNYIAWTGTDSSHKLNIMSSGDMETWTSKVVLNESSMFGPSIAYAKGLMFISWIGTDRRINLRWSYDGQHWDPKNKFVLPQASIASPCLLFVDPYLYLTWRADNFTSCIYMCRSSEIGSSNFGRYFTSPVILQQLSRFSPTLTDSGADLVLGWTDLAGLRINMMRSSVNSSNPLLTFGSKRDLGSDTASGGISIAYFEGRGYVAWSGNDEYHRINVRVID